MKVDHELELKVLKSLCNGTPAKQGYMLPLLKELHFSTSATQGIFRRIIRLSATGNPIPTWTDLSHDPGIKQDTRRMMRAEKIKTISTEEKIDSALSTLERLRKVRMLYELGANLEKALDEDEIDPDAILEQVQKDSSLVGNHAVQTVITRIGGKDSNVAEVLKKILTQGGQRRIPTGIQAFDSQNVGFPLGGAIILAAGTGSGKSALANQIAQYMAMQGAKVANVPLEMDAEENVTRDLARVTLQSMSNLIDPLKRINLATRKDLYKTYMRYSKQMSKRGGSFDIIEPGFAATIENLLAFIDPLDYDVVVIDYVGLMDGVNGDDQWRALSNAVAYAKRWAGRPGKKRLVIFAAQITDDDKLKQSKAMADHCTNVWRWRVGDQEREDGIVVIHQDKCRGGAVFDIPLKFDFEHMTFRDLTKQELEEWQLASRERRKEGNGGSSWKAGNKKSKRKDLHDDDDEGEDDAKPSKIKPRKAKARFDKEY